MCQKYLISVYNNSRHSILNIRRCRKCVCSSKHPTHLYGPPNFLFNGYKRLVPGV